MEFILRLLLLLYPVVLLSQSGNYDFKEAENKSRQLIYIYPDSALSIIKKTLAQKGNIHDTIKGNSYSLYGMYYGMTGNPDSSLYYFKKALGYVEKYPRIHVRVLNNTGIAYRNKADYKTSIKYLNQSLAINKQMDNKVGIAMVYGELASNYNYMLEYDKSIDYLLKSIAIFKAENNTRQLVAVKQKLANTYLGTENYAFAIDLYKECLPQFLEIGMEKNYYLTLVNLGEAYIRTGELDLAKAALNEAAGGLGRYGDRELIGIAYSKVADIEKQEGNTASAELSYQKAIDNLTEAGSSRIVRIGAEYLSFLYDNREYKKGAEVLKKIEAVNKYESANVEDKMMYELARADIYNRTGNEKAAILGYKNAIFIMDTLRATDTKRAVNETQAKFQTELQREKNVALQAKNDALEQVIALEKKFMFLYISISIAVLVIILALLRTARLKTKLQQEEIKRVETEKDLIIQQNEHEHELNKAQKDVIEEKQRELTSSALRMANYQDNIFEIIDRCEKKELKSAEDVKKELLHLSKQKDYWKQFETRFNSLHPEFGNRLLNKFPKLTKNDIEFCSLLKLNLSNKEIASLLQISHESAITKKYRIKKKMDIIDDTEFERIILEI